MPSPALRRPEPPATVPAIAAAHEVVDQAQQRQLDPGDPLRVALAVLQLAKVPRSVGSLHRKILERFPAPERSWSWDLASAYAAVFDAICQASGSSARARSGGGQA